MSDEAGQQKTEAATPRKREEARRQGRVASSGDLTSGLLLFVSTCVLWLGGEYVAGVLREGMISGLRDISPAELAPTELMARAVQFFTYLLQAGGALALTMFATTILVGLLQSGFAISTEPLSPDWGRMSPIKGWSRIMGIHSFARGVNLFLKVGVIAIAVWWFFSGGSENSIVGTYGSLPTAVAAGWNAGIMLALAIAAGLVLLGLADYLFQRWRFEQDLMMSRQEIRDEHKQEEGDPMLRARIRKLQREAANSRMLRDVPSATVVLTNPTHLAIALRYDRSRDTAPTVVAKGSGAFAKRIARIARENGVPVLERKPIARALYGAVQVGSEIPPVLYHVIAEILAYVYKLRNAA